MKKYVYLCIRLTYRREVALRGSATKPGSLFLNLLLIFTNMKRIKSTILILAASAFVAAAASVVGPGGVLAKKLHDTSQSRPSVTQRAVDPQVNIDELTAAENALPMQSSLLPTTDPQSFDASKAGAFTRTSTIPTNPNGKVRMYFLTCQYWANPDELGKGTYYIDVDEDKEKHVVWDMTANKTFGPYCSNGSFVIDDNIYIIYGLGTNSEDWCISHQMLNDWAFGFWYQGGSKIRAYDHAYDPWTDTLWGYTYYDYGKSQYILAKFDWENKQTYDWKGEVIDYNNHIRAIAADKDWLWTFDKNGKMFRVSKVDGSRTEIGQAVPNLTTGYASAGIDWKTGRLFLTCTIYNSADGTYTSSLYEVNKTNAEVTPIKQWNYRHDNVGLWCEEVGGLAVPETATGVEVNVPAGELEGFINFTAPNKLRNGSALSGELDYEVYLNGELASSGKCQAGANVAAPISVKNADSYKISVKTANAAGPSRYARERAIIGMAKPAAPQPALSYNENGQPVISWPAVDKSAKGIEIDSKDVTYTVVRYPDKVTILDNDSLLTVTDTKNFPDGQNIYWYGVTSRYCDVTNSDEAATDGFAHGIATAPYEWQGFNSINWHAFKIYNNDGDSYQFKFDNTYDKERDYMQLWGTSYGTEGANDDWLVAPGVQLDGNMYYRVEFLLKSATNSNVNYSVRLGKTQNMADLTLNVEDGRYIYSSGVPFEWHGNYVKITDAGVYYPAVGTTDVYGTGLAVKGYRISDAKDPKAPGAATNLTGKSNVDNAKLLEVSFLAPAKDFDGNALASLDKVVVELDGNEVITFNEVTPGQTLSFTKLVEATGREYTFNVYGINQYGKGLEMQAPVFAGIRKSAPVTNAYAWQSAPDKMTVSWDIPTVDEIGNPIKPSSMTYTVAVTEGYVTTVKATGLTEPTCTFDIKVDNPNDQEFLTYQVYTTTEGGNSETTYTIPVAVGNPIPYPYKESVAGASISQPLGLYTLVGNAKWALYSDSSFTDVTSADNDGGLLGMNGATVGESALLLLPKVKLTDAINPVMSLYSYNIAGASQNQIEILVNDGSGFKSIGSAVVKDLGTSDWNRMKVSLAQYKGKEIQVAVKGIIVNYTYILVDNMSIAENIADNLQLTAVTIPSAAAKGAKIPVQANVANTGDNEASGFYVQLFRDGEKVDEIQAEPLAAGKQALFDLVYKSTPYDGKRIAFDVVVDYGKDGDKTDNESETQYVSLSTPKHPKVTDLVATLKEKGKVELTWSELESGSTTMQTINDSFEGAAAWETSEADGWLLIDKDGANNGGMQNLNIPGVSGKATSFFVVDSESDIFGSSKASWKSQDGGKHLAALYASGKQNDDWAISPLLSGEAQEITFYARSYSGDYKETMRVMYTTGNDRAATESYVEAQKFENMSEEWTLYKVSLPAGAKYFAFNCISDDCFMLFIDNVTYNGIISYELQGYNIYRNGLLINNELKTKAGHVDVDVPTGTHSYAVSAVWNHGESDASNEASLVVTGVEAISSDAVSVTASQGEMRILNAAGKKLVVTNAAGIMLYNGVATDNMVLKVAPGVYALKVDGKFYKVMVK